MFTDAEFDQLARRLEAETLEFKAEAYDLESPEARISMLKDITAMANTPRDGSGLIVLGVKKWPDGRHELWGNIAHRDDAELQAQLASGVSPVPRVRYHPLHVLGADFGVIEVLPARDGPYLPIDKDVKRFRYPKLYYRQETMIREASAPADFRRIQAWFDGGRAPQPSPEVAQTPAWDALLESLDGFDERRSYVLVAPPIGSEPTGDLVAIGLAPWSTVVDLDTSTESSGLLAACRSVLEARRYIHLRMPGQTSLENPVRATYWYWALGTDDAPVTQADHRQRNWFAPSRRPLQDFIRTFAAASSPTPITIVVLWYGDPDQRLMEKVVDDVQLQAEGLSRLVFLAGNASDASGVAEELGADLIEIPFHHIASGLRSLFPSEDPKSIGVTIPTKSGVPEVIDLAQLRWLQEEVEIVDLYAGEAAPTGQVPGFEFLRGGVASWYDLASRQDVERDVEAKLRGRIEAQLTARRIQRINLYHRPGAGGTTLGRRILWDFHKRVPAVVIQKSAPRETVERLANLAGRSQLPVLALVDSANVSTAEADELYELLASRNLTVVVVQVLRRFSPHKAGPQSFDLAAQLSIPEAVKLADRLSAEVPERRNAMLALTREQDSTMRSAFYFGLTAFGEDFRGIEPFVVARLQTLQTDAQSRILVFLSLAHHYGQQTLPAQMFAKLLGVPTNRTVRLPLALGVADVGTSTIGGLDASVMDLLVDAGLGNWRTTHDLVALQILQTVLGSGLTDVRAWRNRLADWAIAFADLCHDAGDGQSDQLLDILRRIFIFRDNTELLGTEGSATKQFAQLIEDIPSTEGAARVLHRLTELFPDEPHFWAHLGRHYSIERREYDSAVNFIDQAIHLDETDGTLQHMKGMVMRQQVYEAMDRQAVIEEAVSLAERSAEAFMQARELNPDTEHGYISEIQMLNRLLDYVGRTYEEGLLAYLARRDANVFLRDSFDKAEDLLERVRINRQGRPPSQYEEECRASLDRLYGRYDRALESWNNLLDRQDVYKPPIRRQIVRTYLARRNRSWHDLSASEADRIAELLESNLREEPDREQNLRLWIRVIRKLAVPPSLPTVIERVAYWHATSNALDSSYYLYVLYDLEAIEGSRVSLDQASRFLEESKARARYRALRTWSFEWVGFGHGISGLVHQSELGEWNRDSDFWENPSPLRRLEGRISKIDGPHAGEITLPDGPRAFFVPGKSDFLLGRDENRLVSFFLGFSYDGPRAWQVDAAEQEATHGQN